MVHKNLVIELQNMRFGKSKLYGVCQQGKQVRVTFKNIVPKISTYNFYTWVFLAHIEPNVLAEISMPL